ncbi:MAG TPA: hypothetical protein VL967_00715 [Terracidiphilus sp.]|nr:hypothetical protein [Terracidiphilus sp.]
MAQAPAVTTEAHASSLGYSYSLPSDWDVIGSPTLSDLKQQAQQSASSEDEKKGVACVDIALTARHGDPVSVIVVVQLPFDCFGQAMSTKDLPGFAQGAAEGIKQSFDISDPIYGDYKLGTHSMWAERAKGTPKGHPEIPPYTVEISCTLLKKGAVCWMAMAANDATLKVFETSAATLEDDPPAALVSATAFDKKPEP